MFTPLHQHSFYSLLDGLGRPDRMAKRIASLGYGAAALTDHGSVSGVVDFWKACREEGVRPIAGNEFYISRVSPREEKGDKEARKANGRPYDHLVVLSRDREGWKRLIRATSRSASKEYTYYSPRLGLEDFRDFAGDGHLLAFSGHPGSALANAVFVDPKQAYSCTTYEQARGCVRPDVKENLVRVAEEHLSVFGRGNFFVEIQILDPDGMPACLVVAKALRWLAKKLKIPTLATADSHYVTRQDAFDQRVLLCNRIGTSIREVRRKVEEQAEMELGGFFRGDHFHIPSEEEMLAHHTPAEVAMSSEIAASCEDYELTAPPRMPGFVTPDGSGQVEYLTRLCEAGYDRLIRGKDLPRPEHEYRERLAYEMDIFTRAGICEYFNVVQDVTGFARERGWLMGVARGSAGGCLVSYLTGIIGMDPIEHDLMVERFYDSGRVVDGRATFPDIDLDFQARHVDAIYRHVQGKYGRDRVAKIATFNSLQGSAALQEVFRAHEVPYDVATQITKSIPDKARIAEELQEMADAGEEPSIIRWTLEHQAKDLAEWVRLEDDGSLSGDFAAYFSQATRLEGMKKNSSIHAAGIVISPVPIEEVAPVVWNEEQDSLVAMMDYPALESMGLLKVDILTVRMFDVISDAVDFCLTGRVPPHELVA